MTLEQLDDAFLKMMSPEWKYRLKNATKETQDKAARTLLAVQEARLRLGNETLKGIRDKLIANEKPLKEGVADLKQSLAEIENVKKALDAASAFLSVVGRVIALAA
jgi:hypothetical protein